MHVRNHVLIFLSVALLSGCGATQPPPTVGMDHLSPEQLTALEAIKIYSQTKTIKQQFDIVTTVQGISCKRSMWGKAATRRDAILQTRYRAQQAGANAIIYLRCDHQRDAAYDGPEIVICNGEAIKSK